MEARDFTSAVRQYQGLLYHVSHTMLRDADDCADAVQEALMRAWSARGTLRNEALFKSWLIRILVNTCNDMLRKRKRAPVALSGDVPEDRTDHLPLYDALDRLDASLRLPILLHYLHGMPVAEVARSLGLSQSLVKNRMMRGRKRLAEMLGEEVTE